MYLIDTDVLSALRRHERHPAVSAWLSSQRSSDLYLSAITIGEIERGIVKQQGQDPGFAGTLASWLDGLLAIYNDRILPLDVATCRRWGRLTAELGHSSADLLIAATALEHGLAVVTGNARHFEPTGVTVVNPFGD